MYAVANRFLFLRRVLFFLKYDGDRFSITGVIFLVHIWGKILYHSSLTKNYIFHIRSESDFIGCNFSTGSTNRKWIPRTSILQVKHIFYGQGVFSTSKSDPLVIFRRRSLFVVTPAYGVFISQLIQYTRACSSYECFILRARRLSSKLLKKGYLVECLK